MLVKIGDPCRAWYLVRTKPKQERVVDELLRIRGLPTHLPRILEPPSHRRAPRNPVPLFPSYLFVQCVLSDVFSDVNYCPGAAGVVRFGQEFAAVEDEFICFLQERQQDRGFLVMGQARKAPTPGSRARVVGGVFAGYEGLVQSYLPARDRVKLLLMLVGGQRLVEVEARHVRCA
jgi:transcription antitermination factor NusG